MATKTFLADKDAMDRFQPFDADPNHRRKNGSDAHLMVGQTQQGVIAFIFRSYVHFAMDWTEVGKITSATLHLRTSILTLALGNKHTSTVGNAPITVVWPLNAAFSEPVDGEYVFGTPNLHWAVPAQEPARDTSLKVQFVPPITPNTDLNVDITSLIEPLAPNTVMKRDGAPGDGKTHHGFALTASSETLQAQFAEFFGRASTNVAAARPFITLTYEPANVAPGTTPSGSGNLQPAGSVTSATNFTGNFIDANPADKLASTNIRIYQGATLLWDKTFVATSAEVAAGAFSVPIPALIRSGVTYDWDVRLKDSSGLWGAFSPKVSFRILNTKPSVTLTSLGSYASLSGVKFEGTYSDPESDKMGSYRIQLRVTTAPGHPDWDGDNNKWDSGEVPPRLEEISGNQFSRTYAGVGLTAASYSWRARAADKWGEWSDWQYGSITLTAAWNPDPGAINFLTGFNERKPRARIIIRQVDTSAGRGPKNPPVAIIEDAANIGASSYLNAPGEFYFTLPATHPQVSVIEPYQTHYTVEVWNGDRFREVFHGLLTDFDATDDDVVFYGVDYLGLLEKVVDSRYDPVVGIEKPYTTGGSKYVAEDLTTIINDQLTMAKAKSNSPVNFITVSTLDTFVEEVTTYSTFTPVLTFIQGLMDSHRQGTGKRSRFWVRRNTAGTGFEFLLKDDPGTERDNIKVEYGGLLQGFRLTAFGNFSTFLHGFGRPKEGVNVFYSSEQATGIDPAVWGRIEAVRAYDDISDKNDLQRRLKQEAARAARIGKNIALGLRVDALQPFDGFDIADHIPLDIKRGVVDTSLYGSGYWTIVGVEWRVFPDAHTEMTLVVLPREDDVAPDSNLIPSVPIFASREWEVGYVPPVQGVNVGKFYLDLTTGKTYVLLPDGTYADLDTPGIPIVPDALVLNTDITTDATGDPIVKLTVTINQDVSTANRGTWVEVTPETFPGSGIPDWEHAILLFIPNGETSTSIEGVAGSTLYYARAWSVNFVGTFSTQTAVEQHTSVKDEDAPSVPTALSLVGTVRGFFADWDTSTAADLAFYEIRYAPDDGSGTGPGGTPNWTFQRARTSFIFVGSLLGNTKYWMQVRAIDRSGNVNDAGVTRNYLAFPEVGWTLQLSATTTNVDSDLLELGSVGDAHIVAAGLTAAKITTGLLKISVSDASAIDGIQVFNSGVLVGFWNETGLYIYSNTDATDYIRVYDGGVSVFNNGVEATALDKTGLNASIITWGTMPGALNVIQNSSFEMNAFSVPTTVNTVWTAAADWNGTRSGSATNVTTNAGDLQETGATF